MFTDIGREVVQGLNNDSSLKSIKYHISFLKTLDDERRNMGETCCETIRPTAICFRCFEHHLDKILLSKLRRILWDKYKETAD